jgi:AraC-like DNA-binding protein
VRYAEHDVPMGLSRHVDAIWTLTSRGRPAPRDAGTILPDGCIEIVVCAAGAIRPSGGAAPLSRCVVGPMERRWRVEYLGAVDLIGIRVIPSAARVLLRTVVPKLTNRIVSLRQIAPALDAELRHAVRHPSGVVRRKRVAAVLTRSVEAAGDPDAVVAVAVDLLRRSRGSIPIRTLAASLGVGERLLERRFRREAGLTPKRWARIVRFQEAFQASDDEAGEPWADVAQRLGYADQPHLVREFTELAGVPPGRIPGARRNSSRRAEGR